MIRNFNKKSNWYAKFRVMHLIGSRQLEVSTPTGRIRNVNACDVHKICHQII